MEVGSVACFGGRHSKCPEAKWPRGGTGFLCQCLCHASKKEVDVKDGS